MASSALNVYIMVQNRYFALLGNTHNLVYYPIVSYQNIKVYRVETMDMGKIPLTYWCRWNMQIQLYP